MRGINVGSARKLPMADLRALCTKRCGLEFERKHHPEQRYLLVIPGEQWSGSAPVCKNEIAVYISVSRSTVE